MDNKIKEQEAKLASMEADKEKRIRHYMELQDQADAMNEQIYRVCCEVEGLNVQINALKEELKLAALKAAKPGNGVHKPANGHQVREK